MTDKPNTTSAAAGNGPAHESSLDEPGFVDGIPVEELVRLTREFTARITNEDRQHLAAELNESGHQHLIQSSAPHLLQQFFTGRVDLDVELARRYPASPLLSSAQFSPEPGKRARYGFAQFSGQDGAASLSIEAHGTSGALNISFLLHNMIGVRFVIGATAEPYRKRFLELMRRQDGIAFLWTRERWQSDYLIFVVREYFARVYAFGPNRFDGACRLTPEGINNLVTWLGGFWLPDEDAVPGQPSAASSVPDTTPSSQPAEEESSADLTW